MRYYLALFGQAGVRRLLGRLFLWRAAALVASVDKQSSAMRDVTSGEALARQPSTLRGWVAGHPLGAFVTLAYLISWAWWVPFVVAGDTFRQGVAWPTQIPGLAGPLVAAVIVTWVADGREGLVALWRSVAKWRVGWWWLAVPITLGAGATGWLMSAGDIVAADLTTYSGIAKSLGPLATIAVVFVFNGLGEEAGWRGFAVARLLGTRSLTATSLIVAAMWAPWHLPMFFALESFEAFTALEIVGWVIGITAGSFLLSWLFRGSGGSVLLVAVWHTAFNFTSAATPATEGVVAAITSTAVMVAAVVIAVADRRQRKTPERPAEMEFDDRTDLASSPATHAVAPAPPGIDGRAPR